MQDYRGFTRFLNVILTAALLWFAYDYIAFITRDIDFSAASLHPGLTLLSVLVFALSYGLFSLNWLLSARIFIKDATLWQVLVFFVSQPYKYLPTSLFIFSSRAVYGQKLGLTLKQSSVAQVFENATLLAANFALFCVLYATSVNVFYGVILFTMVVVVFPLSIYGYRVVDIRFLGKSVNIQLAQLIKMYLISLAGWLVGGLAFVILNTALDMPVNVINMLAANTIAFLASILAVFAPGGIGVRELVYNFFGLSGVAIIYWRILVFIFDIVIGVFANFAMKYKANRTKVSDQS